VYTKSDLESPADWRRVLRAHHDPEALEQALRRDAHPLAPARLAQCLAFQERLAEAELVVLHDATPLGLGVAAAIRLDRAVRLPALEREAIYRELAAGPDAVTASPKTASDLEGQMAHDFVRGQALCETGLAALGGGMIRAAQRLAWALGVTDTAMFQALSRCEEHPELRLELHQQQVRAALLDHNPLLIQSVASDLAEAACMRLDHGAIQTALPHLRGGEQKRSLLRCLSYLAGDRSVQPVTPEVPATNNFARTCQLIWETEQALVLRWGLQGEAACQQAVGVLNAPVPMFAPGDLSAQVDTLLRATAAMICGRSPVALGLLDSLHSDHPRLNVYARLSMAELLLAQGQGRAAALPAIHRAAAALHVVPEVQRLATMRYAARLNPNAVWLMADTYENEARHLRSKIPVLEEKVRLAALERTPAERDFIQHWRERIAQSLAQSYAFEWLLR
jgi:hypothetical protein